MWEELKKRLGLSTTLSSQKREYLQQNILMLIQHGLKPRYTPGEPFVFIPGKEQDLYIRANILEERIYSSPGEISESLKKTPDACQSFNSCAAPKAPQAPKAVRHKTARDVAGTYIIDNDPNARVSLKLAQIFLDAEKKYGINHEILITCAYREGSLRPDIVNTDTGAVGLFQFVPRYPYTIYEVAYKYAESEGYKGYRNMIIAEERTNKNGSKYMYYGPKNQAAAAKITELFKDPKFNTAMFCRYHKDKVQVWETMINHKRQTTPAEFLAMNNLGFNGFLKFVRAAWADDRTLQKNPNYKERLSVDHFNRTLGKQNPTLIRHDDGKGLYKTLRETLFGLQEESIIRKTSNDYSYTTQSSTAEKLMEFDSNKTGFEKQPNVPFAPRMQAEYKITV